MSVATVLIGILLCTRDLLQAFTFTLQQSEIDEATFLLFDCPGPAFEDLH